MKIGDVYVYKLPAGLYAVAGGTRTEVKLSRPWQKDIIIDPSKCPFERVNESEVVSRHYDGEWLLLKNKFTPFPFHRLIIPSVCWPKEELRKLGYLRGIVAALKIGWEEGVRQGLPRFTLGAHIGPLAGQNLAHLHFHLIHPNFPHPEVSSEDLCADHGWTERYVRTFTEDPALRIWENEVFRVAAYGHRAGQCFVVPKQGPMELNDTSLSWIAGIYLSIIERYAERMTSSQGLPPDYQVFWKFRGEKFSYGFYLPVLNHWGITEYAGLLGEEPLVLPWPHEVMAEYLR